MAVLFGSKTPCKLRDSPATGGCSAGCAAPICDPAATTTFSVVTAQLLVQLFELSLFALLAIWKLSLVCSGGPVVAVMEPQTLIISIVSCDIVGHSAGAGIGLQTRRVEGINGVVRGLIEEYGESIVWASGGDGGHTCFLQPDWQQPTIEYICRLRRWALENDVPLRVTGTRGPAALTRGADGRCQPVGDAINLSGRILEYAGPSGVIVTEEFKHDLGPVVNQYPLRYHSPREFAPRHFSRQRLWLLSIADEVRSTWEPPCEPDGAALSRMNSTAECWAIAYHARRAMQADIAHAGAIRALRRLDARQWTVAHFDGGNVSRSSHPLLGMMDARTRVDFIRAGALVERRAGEMLCSSGDNGNTMFIVLVGRLAAFSPRSTSVDPGTGSNSDPLHIFRPGDIVGELAYVLRRPRTASLVALEDTALLSFSSEQLEAVTAAERRTGPLLLQNIQSFVTARVLEYVCNRLPCLAGCDPPGPLAEMDPPAWEELLDETRLITFQKGTANFSLGEPLFEQDGLYLLISGRLRSRTRDHQLLEGQQQPILFADFPDRLVTPDHHWEVAENDTKVLNISARAFLDLPDEQYRGFLEALSRAVSYCYYYDVFLSYSFADEAVAGHWKESLESAGLRVFMQVSHVGHHFPDRIAAGLLDSLALVVLISAQTVAKELDRNWVRREVAYREATFGANDGARILPVRLEGGRVEEIASGHATVDAVNREADAIEEVICTVRAIREGTEPPPFGRIRRLGTAWQEY